MAWVTTAIVDNILGSTEVTAILWAVDGSYSSGSFAQAEAAARADVVSYVTYAGYSSPGATIDAATDAGAFLIDIAACLMISRAFARSPGIAWPGGDLRDNVEASVAKLNAIYEKRLPVPGLVPSLVSGYGGTSASPTTGDDARPARLSRAATRRW